MGETIWIVVSSVIAIIEVVIGISIVWMSWDFNDETQTNYISGCKWIVSEIVDTLEIGWEWGSILLKILIIIQGIISMILSIIIYTFWFSIWNIVHILGKVIWTGIKVVFFFLFKHH